MKLAKMGLPLKYDLGKNVYTAEDIEISTIYKEEKKCITYPNLEKIQTFENKDIMRITGKIIDDMGEGVPQAHIFNATKNTGAISDNNGIFALQAEEDDNIEISFVGFSTIKAKAKDLGKTIQMQVATNELPEVVVTPNKKQVKCPLICWLKEHKDMVMIGLGVLSVSVAIYAVSKQKKKEDVR